jgi:hypothetical protein
MNGSRVAVMTDKSRLEAVQAIEDVLRQLRAAIYRMEYHDTTRKRKTFELTDLIEAASDALLNCPKWMYEAAHKGR